jgi:hypothetical protein
MHVVSIQPLSNAFGSHTTFKDGEANTLKGNHMHYRMYFRVSTFSPDKSAAGKQNRQFIACDVGAQFIAPSCTNKETNK